MPSRRRKSGAWRFSTALFLLSASCAAGAQLRAGSRRADPPTEDEVGYLLDILKKFRSFAEESKVDLSEYEEAKKTQIQAAAATAQHEGAKQALLEASKDHEANMLAAGGIYDAMINFSEHVETLLEKTASQVSGCEKKECGRHATCSLTSKGAECVCDEGYVGHGLDCHAPYDFRPHPLVVGSKNLKAVDLHLTIFGNDRIAIVFREDSESSPGSLIVGRAKAGGLAAFAPPERFTADGEMAFAPVVEGLSADRAAIAWRNKWQNGDGFLRVATFGGTGIRGADTAITWGETVKFCQRQSHQMALVGLPEGRFAVLFASPSEEETTSGQVLGTVGLKSLIATAPTTPVGGQALIATSAGDGSLTLSGTFRFTDTPVCRLEVAKLSPTSFVIAARSSPVQDKENKARDIHQEAMAILGDFVDEELAFAPTVLNLEPNEGEIWARGVSRIDNQTFAYAYQDGGKSEIKQAIVHVHTPTKAMKVLSRDQVLRRGLSSYVNMISMPELTFSPHTMAMFEDTASNVSFVEICSWSTTGSSLQDCEAFPWLNEAPATQIAAGALPGGRFVVGFTARSGQPFYTIFSVARK